MSASEREDIQIWPQPTPNPSAIRFVTNRRLLEWGSRDFPAAETAAGNPLPEKLFALRGVAGVMIGTDFVTISEGSEADWNSLGGEVMAVIRDHLLSGEPVVAELEEPPPSPEEDGISRKIVEILDREIRPAVAMDGGDVIFRKYQDGVVWLSLQGSCHGCPSSTATLRMGIEERLRASVPEVREVVSS
jgi:Fe-S cluster biogenesis protein NfuA